MSSVYPKQHRRGMGGTYEGYECNMSRIRQAHETFRSGRGKGWWVDI